MNLLEEMEKDKKLFKELRKILTRGERLWLLDVGGNYEKYRARLRRLAHDYKIEIPEAK